MAKIERALRMASTNIPYRSQDDLIGLGCRAAQIVDSIERTIRGSVEGTVWAAPEPLQV